MRVYLVLLRFGTPWVKGKLVAKVARLATHQAVGGGGGPAQEHTVKPRPLPPQDGQVTQGLGHIAYRGRVLHADAVQVIHLIQENQHPQSTLVQGEIQVVKARDTHASGAHCLTHHVPQLSPLEWVEHTVNALCRHVQGDDAREGGGTHGGKCAHNSRLPYAPCANQSAAGHTIETSKPTPC